MIINHAGFYLALTIFLPQEREILSPIPDETALKPHASWQTYLYRPYMTVPFPQGLDTF